MANQTQLLTSREVAELFGVRLSTVVRWAATDRLAVVRTPGGQLRFRQADIDALLRGDVSGSSAQAGGR